MGFALVGTKCGQKKCFIYLPLFRAFTWLFQNAHQRKAPFVTGNFMTLIPKTILFALTLLMFSCNTPADRQESSVVKSVLTDSISLTHSQTTETEQDSDCIRGQAEPIIQKEDYPNTTFILQPDSVTAVETVNFDNGDKLIINNWGCKYYVLTFRFETTKFQHNTTNLEYWFKAANRLMTGMLSGLDAPIDIKRGLVFLDSYILRDEKNKFKTLKLRDEIDFDGSEIRSFVTVDRIEKISDKKFAVTLSFATGPL